uniref:Uncharacterized protein n=1 Tax=Solanum tuberosum TaxID=4113 RepID=M1D921_SOLTU
MLGKLPSEDTTRQAREGLGYSQPPPIRIYIRRESNNHITFEDEVTTPNKKPFVFDRLGESTARTFVFERLEELKAKAHTVVYTKEREEDEESVGSSYHVTIHNEHDALPKIKIDEELEDIKLSNELNAKVAAFDAQQSNYEFCDTEKALRSQIEDLKREEIQCNQTFLEDATFEKEYKSDHVAIGVLEKSKYLKLGYKEHV